MAVKKNPPVTNPTNPDDSNTNCKYDYKVSEKQGFEILENGENCHQDDLIADITHDNKRFSMVYPFQNKIVPEQTDKEVFSNEFVMSINLGDKIVKLFFHDKNLITIDNITFPISKIPFLDNETLSNQFKEYILTGEKFLLEMVYPRDIKNVSISFGSVNEWGNAILTFKTIEKRDKFLNEVGKTELIPSEQFKVYSCMNDRYLSIEPVNLTIESTNGNYIRIQDSCNDGIMIDSKYFKDDNDILNKTVTELIKDELFYFTYKSASYETKIYLKPIYFENDNFIIKSEKTQSKEEISRECDEQLINFSSFGLSAYENGQKINELPLNDRKTHIIEFKDKQNNIYEYCYSTN